MDYPIVVRQREVPEKSDSNGQPFMEVLPPNPEDIIPDDYAVALIAELNTLPQAWVYVVSRVLNRPTPEGFVEWRDGPSNTRICYVAPEYAIATRAALARIGVASDFEVLQTDVSTEACESLCKLTLKYFHNGSWATITAMQWGDCTRRSGMELGSAKKGSATDGLKKCFHELGWARDVYSTPPVKVAPPDPEQMRLQSIEGLYTIAGDKGLTGEETDKLIAIATNGGTVETIQPKDVTSLKRKLQRMISDELKEYMQGSKETSEVKEVLKRAQKSRDKSRGK